MIKAGGIEFSSSNSRISRVDSIPSITGICRSISNALPNRYPMHTCRSITATSMSLDLAQTRTGLTDQRQLLLLRPSLLIRVQRLQPVRSADVLMLPPLAEHSQYTQIRRTVIHQ